MRHDRFRLRLLLAFIPLGIASLVACAPARAYEQCGWGLYNRLGFGWGYMSPYSLGQVPVPPYFALHPPVYYSAPVPRTYGYSPFAYPGHTPTPEIATVVEPAVIDNPYVAPTSLPAAPGDREPDADSSAAAQPKMILNPFVVQSPENAVVEVAKSVR